MFIPLCHVDSVVNLVVLYLKSSGESSSFSPRTALTTLGLSSRSGVGKGAACLCLKQVSVLSPLQAIHEAVMSISENGTEHAGATLSEESAWSEHLTINFNMPFLIIIKDENTNIPLFMGKVVNPMQK